MDDIINKLPYDYEQYKNDHLEFTGSDLEYYYMEETRIKHCNDLLNAWYAIFGQVIPPWNCGNVGSFPEFDYTQSGDPTKVQNLRDEKIYPKNYYVERGSAKTEWGDIVSGDFMLLPPSYIFLVNEKLQYINYEIKFDKFEFPNSPYLSICFEDYIDPKDNQTQSISTYCYQRPLFGNRKNSSCGEICYGFREKNINISDYTYLKFKDCENIRSKQIWADLQKQKKECLDKEFDIQQKIDALFKKKDFLTEDFNESFKVNFPVNYYHYTLYYYDRAGNLVRTVPPKGIDVNLARLRTGAGHHPEHLIETFYQYNSLGQIIHQKSPDEDFPTDFYYNLKGQLRFSQSARQKNVNDLRFSFTKYDKLGRIFETGEASTDAMLIGSTFYDYLSENEDDFPQDNLKMIIKTVYYPVSLGYDYYADKLPRPYPAEFIRENLRNRISYTLRDDDGQLTGESSENDMVRTFYSYDPHGNVNWVVQDLPMKPEADVPKFDNQNGSDFTRFVSETRYEYNLLSGTVKSVMYDRLMAESHYQKYSYDEDNRIIKTETSRFTNIWDRDGEYEYYLHGPLKRIEIGDDFLQGIDYIYNINGWIKGINHSRVDYVGNDPGGDGYGVTDNGCYVKDQFGMILGYNYYDYINTQSSNNFESNAAGRMTNDIIPTPIVPGSMTQLYNGNISSWEIGYSETVKTKIQAYYDLQGNSETFNQFSGFHYKYDLLNRIKSAERYNLITGMNPVWSKALNNDYNADYCYDPNGNIINLNRNAHSGEGTNNMDRLSYRYNWDVNNDIYNNRLDTVSEAEPTTRFDGDLEKFNNGYILYNYDESGNLISDNLSQIDNIEWTVDGKIGKIIFNQNHPNLFYIKYLYDARGDRIKKIESQKYIVMQDICPTVNDGLPIGMDERKKYTYYMRDANGKIMAIYELERTCGYTPHTWEPDDPHGDGNISVIVKSESRVSTHGVFSCIPYVPWIPGTGGGLPLINIYHDALQNQDRLPKLCEWHIYGSGSQGRFCIRKPENDVYYMGLQDEVYSHYDWRYLRFKNYELKDHLDNVRLVFSDLKLSSVLDNGCNSNWTANYNPLIFDIDLIAVNNYYPFGMLQPGQIFSSESYRFGFNGKENDNEVKGTGNQQDYGARIYDTRLGRFLSIDPLTRDYPMLTPYQFASNTPIMAVDLDGLESRKKVILDENGGVSSVQLKVDVKLVDGSNAGLNTMHKIALIKIIEKTMPMYFDREYGENMPNYSIDFKGTIDPNASANNGDYVLKLVPNGSEGANIAGRAKIGNHTVNTMKVCITETFVADYLNELVKNLDEKDINNGVLDKRIEKNYNFKNVRNFPAWLETFFHEWGHSVGLRHENDPENSQDIKDKMDEIKNQTDPKGADNPEPNFMLHKGSGDGVIPEQMKSIEEFVPEANQSNPDNNNQKGKGG